MIEIRLNGSFEEWKKHVRDLLRQHVLPSEVIWSEKSGQQTLFAVNSPRTELSKGSRVPGQASQSASSSIRVPQRFIYIARKVSTFREDRKWHLLYSVLYRITYDHHHLLKIETDDEVIQLLRMADAVDRDVHHVHAFVRFKKISEGGSDRYVAWYKPDHKVIRLAAPFFKDRFASMRWSLLTPDGSAHWDGEELRFTAGVANPPESGEDALEELWSRYYATIFNPARTNLRMMRSEMPQRFWQHMPEMHNLPRILQQAPQRVEDMMALQKKTPGAAAFIPPNASLQQLRSAIPNCRGCELYQCATQAVFGEGPAHARVVLIGEQPGDQEDLAGKPFIGPAGQVLDRALAEAGVTRSEVYVTNAVKHFAFEPRGKSRIHRTPKASEVTACRPWMDAEISIIKPAFVVCLGATAAKSVFGAQFRLTADRGKFLESRFSPQTLATYHPSAVLRGDTPEARDMLYHALLTDLKTLAHATHSRAAHA